VSTKARTFPNQQVLAATGDPVTSLLAAEHFTTSGKRSEKKRAMLHFLLTQSEPLTSFEIAVAMGWDRHDVAKRLPDLRADGFAMNGPLRPCRITGKAALTWGAASIGGGR
jgi:hypothetical protein